jgi:hypothetical protein
MTKGLFIIVKMILRYEASLEVLVGGEKQELEAFRSIKTIETSQRVKKIP